MPPKKGKPDSIATFMPTDAEIQEARKILCQSDAAGKRAKMAAMVAFVKRNDGDASILESRGQARQEYLEKYLGFMARKNAQKVINSKEVTALTEHKTAELYWSEFEMTKEIGPHKTRLWVDSGKLTWRPDPVTGSTEKEHVEYRVPRDWVVKSDAELDKMKMFVDGDAKDDDVVNLKSLSVNSGSASSTGANDVVVKTEPQSADSKVKDRVLAFLADPGSALSTLQEMSIQNKLIAPQASQLKYAMELSKDIAKNAARFFHMFVALDVDVFPGNGSLIGLRYLSNIYRYLGSFGHLFFC